MSTSYGNQGHGHVHPRPDGVRARCGGPGLCAECAREKALDDAVASNPTPHRSMPLIKLNKWHRVGRNGQRDDGYSVTDGRLVFIVPHSRGAKGVTEALRYLNKLEASRMEVK